MRFLKYIFLILLIAFCGDTNAQTKIAISLQSGSDSIICAGGSINFTSNVTGCNSPTYQWYKNGIAVIGQTSQSYSANGFLNGDVITCQQTNTTAPCNLAVSNGIKVTIKPIQITTLTSAGATINQSICKGSLINPITYNITNATGATIVGLPTGVTGIYNNGVFTISGTPSQNGSFTYTITATGLSCGSNPSTSGTIVVNAKPNASFIASPNSGCGSTTVFFTSTAFNDTGSVYDWNFGDINNNQSSNVNAIHTYIPLISGVAKTYIATLIIKNANGTCFDTAHKNIVIGAGPDASFDVTGTSVSPIFNSSNIKIGYKICSPQQSALFNLINQSTTTSTNTKYQIIWGDGYPDTILTSNFTNASHKYDVGLYTIKFIVTNPSCVDTSSYKIFLGTNPAVGIGSPGNTDVCTPATLTFPIDTSATNKNPFGTTYIIHFNDSSADITFNHPAPSFVTHTFLKSSCGASSAIGGANAFYAKITATNPCKTTDAYVTGITVTEKPKAIIASSEDITCINLPTSIFNTGNIQITPYGPSSCNSGNVVWNIQPTTGWTLLPNFTLGDDMNSNNPIDWVTGTAQLLISFSVPGNYVFKLKEGNSCQYDSTVKTVCVNPTPTAAFSFTKNFVCIGDTVSTLNNSSIPVCGKNSYQWILLAYDSTPNCKVDTASFFYVNHSDTSANPIIQFNSPGTYTFQLKTSIIGTLCEASSVPQIIIVGDKPNIKIQPVNDICQNKNITPIANADCYVNNATYSWSFQSGNPATVNTLIPGNIQLTNAGIDTIIFTARNTCGITKDTATVNVAPTPLFTIAPTPATVCSGLPFTINLNSSSVGATYTWTSTAGTSISGNSNQLTPIATISITDNLITTSTTVDTVKYDITIIGPPPLNCVGQTLHVKVIVLAGATPADAGIDSIFCNQSIINLHANNPTVGVGVWKQVAGNTATIVDTSLYNTAVTGLTSGVYKFLWTINTNTTGCSSTQDSVTITIRPTVTTANAGADILKCDFGVNNTQQLNANLNPARPFETGTWTFAGAANGATVNNINASNAIITFTNTGTYQLIWTISSDAETTDSSCKTSSDTINIIVKDFPIAGSISGTNEICKGSNAGTLTLTGNTTSANIQWQNSLDSINYSDIAGANTTSYNAGILNASIWYRIRTYQTNCTDTIISIPFKIQVDNPSIGGNITPILSEVCTNSGNVTLALQGNTGTDINWIYNTNNSGYTSFSPSLTTTNISVNNTPFIQNTTTQVIVMDIKAVVANGVCLADTSVVATIKVYPNTETADAGVDQNLCFQNSATLQATIPATGSGTWSQLSGPTTATIASISTPNTTISNLVVGSYLFKWQLSGSASNICPATFDTVRINNYDTIINKIKSVNDTLCANQTLQINSLSTVSGGDGTYAFQWQQSSDNITWTNITSNGQQENFSTISTLTLYFRRIITSTTCTSTSNVVIVNVQPGLTNNTISSTQQICVNSIPNLLTGLTPSGGNNLYQYQWQQLIGGIWTNILNEVNINYQPPITTIIGDTSFRRIVSSGFCNGDISNVVTISTKGDAKAFYTFTNDILCAPAHIDTNNIKAQDYPATNGTYQWYANGILIGTGLQFPGYIISNNGDTGYIKLKVVSAFGCKNDSFEHKFYTVKTPIVAFTKSVNKGCGPLTVSFTNTSSPINYPTYKWDFGNGKTSTLQTPNAVTFNSDTSYNRHDTTYYIKLTAYTQCDSIVYKDSVTVLPKPKALYQPDTTVGCSVFHFTAFNNSLGSHNTYHWDYGDNSFSTDTIGGFIHHNFTTNKTDTFTIKLTASNTCGIDSFKIKIVVFPNTIVPKLIVDGNNNYGCAPQQIRFINNTIGANKFTVNFGDGSLPYISNNNPDTIYHTYLSGGNYIATMKAENTCTDSTVSLTLVLYKKPQALFSLLPNQFCKNEIIQFKNASDTTLSFEWRFGDGGNSTAIHPNYAYNAAGNYVVTLIAKSTNATGAVCTDTLRKSIIIHDLPTAIFTNNAAIQNCQPFNFIASTIQPTGSIENWIFYDPTSIDTTQAGSSGNHTFYQTGVFNVKLVVLNTFGCSDTAMTQVKVIETPKAKFSMSDTISCVPGKVINCINQSTYNSPDALNYQWYIDGVLTATTKNFSNNFNAPVNITTAVTFTIKMVVINSYGCRDSAIKHFIIIPKAQPSFSVNALQGCVPFSLQINNTSQYTNIYKWFLNGVLFSNAINPSPINLTIPSTSYTIKLVADNTQSCGADSVVKVITTYPKPISNFQIPNKNSCSGILTIQCFDLSTAVGATITKWNWIFGDGETDTLKNPTHIYTTAGHFNVGLIATDNRGCISDISYQTVANFGKPKSDFNINNVCIKNPLLPLALSTPGLGSTAITNYLWNWGDGNYAIGKQPIYVYQNEGNYTVTLIVTSDSSCVADTASKKITVYGKPSADFTIANNCVNENALFTNTSSPGFGQSSIGNSKWIFGDGGFNNNFNATHIYNKTGDYTVLLSVSGNRCPNLLDSIKKIITIHQPRNPVIYPRVEGVRGTPIQLSALSGGVQYNWIPITGLDNPAIQNPTANYNVSNPNIITYTINITDSLGCKVKDKQEVWLFASSDILVPSAFTPNGDGANDLLKPLYVNIARIQYFRVFDRWGKIVFETSDMGKAWDGKLNGNDLPLETYVWVISAITQDGKDIVKKGNVTLIRD